MVGVGVVVWRGDEFLLVRRGKAPNKGQWSIPGGAQQLGETVFSAAAREVLEETGLVVHVQQLVDVVDGIMTDDAGSVVYHYTLVDLVAHSPAGEPVAADDAARVVLAILDQLSTGIEPWGVYHYGSADTATYFEFAEALLASLAVALRHPDIDLPELKMDARLDQGIGLTELDPTA